MAITFSIARREVSALFVSPVAYVVMAVFALGAGLLFFASQFQPGAEATMRTTFALLVTLLVFLLPAVSMRLVSEELRSGAVEMLMTAPISDGQVIVGKWLGAMMFFLVLLSPLLVPIGLLAWYGQPDYGPILTGLLGLILVGGFYLAIGTFASAITQSQMIAFILTLLTISFFTLVLSNLPAAGFVSNDMRQVMFYANVNSQFEDFAKGLLSLHGVVYFASGTSTFLFLAILVLESRRWR